VKSQIVAIPAVVTTTGMGPAPPVSPIATQRDNTGQKQSDVPGDDVVDVGRRETFGNNHRENVPTSGDNDRDEFGAVEPITATIMTTASVPDVSSAW